MSGRVRMEERERGGRMTNGVVFRGGTVTRAQVLYAPRQFDREYPDTNLYDSWLIEELQGPMFQHSIAQQRTQQCAVSRRESDRC